MRCNFCQSEFDDNLQQCPVCGASVPPAEDKAPDYFSQNQATPEAAGFEPSPEPFAPMVNPLLAKTDALVKDNMFLAVCILQTVATALPVFSNFRAFNIISVLITVFLWLIFADSKKGLPNPARIRLLSGAVYAFYVVTYVVAGILALCGILCFFASSTLIGMFTDAFNGGEIVDGFDALMSIGGWVVGLIFIITAILIIVINYFSYGKIHTFVKSCYENIQANKNALECRNATCVWLIVFAVCIGITALGSIAKDPIASVGNGCATAACIVSYLLLKKYYSEY